MKNINFPSFPLNQSLSSGSYLIEDDPFQSKYFYVRGLKDSYGKGIHDFSIQGSNKLVPGSSIIYEFIDGMGNVIKIQNEIDTEQYPSFILWFSIDESIANGIGTLTVVGSSIENNKGRPINNLLYDVRWQTKIRINLKENIDFYDLVAVDNLSFVSGSSYKQSGSSSEDGCLLSWESMYGHQAQYCSHSDGSIKYVSNFKFLHIEDYYVYMFIPSGTLNYIPENPYPATGSKSGVWLLHGITEAPQLSSSQYVDSTASVYYFAGSLSENKFVSFWVGGSRNTTKRERSGRILQGIPNMVGSIPNNVMSFYISKYSSSSPGV